MNEKLPQLPLDPEKDDRAFEEYALQQWEADGGVQRDEIVRRRALDRTIAGAGDRLDKKRIIEKKTVAG